MDKTIYLSQQNLARVIAKAWLDEQFRIESEKEPVQAIKRNFVNTSPPIFPDFELLGIMPERPDGISDEELRQASLEDIFVLPDHYNPPQPDGRLEINENSFEAESSIDRIIRIGELRWVSPRYSLEDGGPTQGRKIYPTRVEWCRITALAWLNPAFRYDLMTDTATAIRSRPEFCNIRFERPLWVPPPPPIGQDSIEQIVNGDRKAIMIPFFTFSAA